MTVMEPFEQGKRILVGVDGSTGSQAALGWALEEAQLRHAEIEAVYAWHLPALAYGAPGFIPPGPEAMDVEARTVLERTLANLPAASDVKVHLRVCDGPPVEVLARAAGEPDVDLVVVGSRGHGGVAELMLGSVSHSLTHHCPKPMVIIPKANGASTPTAPRRVVVGIDGSSEASAALHWAAREAQARGDTLQVVVAWSESKAIFPTEFPLGGSLPTRLHAAARDIIDQAVDTLDATGLTIERTVVQGRPAAVLIELASSADLLVVGNRGRGRAQEALHGSVSHACAHRSPVPLVVIPHCK